ncbi:aKG-HExxH-type peptide beta-hydroxylase [Micromonospora sp. LOL_021]|uniref:aKG-HExxH-type peptide beta-hydroxylase n=1 Tax=Micromonospora sp. LOL_021 TaxID=3345417 RepID=UPI003A850AAC
MAILLTIAPLPTGQRFRPLSASGAEAFGSALLSEPDDAIQLAATLVHESQHHRLGALRHLLTPVPTGGSTVRGRDNPRPVGGLLQR